MNVTDTRAAAGPAWPSYLAAIVCAALDTVGVFAGASYTGFVFGLAAVLLVAGATRRRWPELDRQLLALAALFLVLCWASTLWSIVPERTLRGALQLTGIFAGALILIGQRSGLAARADMILRVALLAAIVGPLLAVLDMLTGHPIMGVLVSLGHTANPINALDSKIDRGLSYLAILIWPLLAHAWRRGRRVSVLAAAAALAAALLLGLGAAGQLAFAAGLVTFVIAAFAPRLAAAGLALTTAILALGMPFIIKGFGASLAPLAARVKYTAAHRFEIWDYMSARALERPWSGWGWWSASALPIHPDELARYQIVTAAGTSHPHNQWLQLWVETGVAGAVLGLLLALLVIVRAWRIAPASRPFALAACAVALVLSLPSYDLATDSWWAALAVTGLLFAIPKEDARRL